MSTEPQHSPVGGRAGCDTHQCAVSCVYGRYVTTRTSAFRHFRAESRNGQSTRCPDRIAHGTSIKTTFKAGASLPTQSESAEGGESASCVLEDRMAGRTRSASEITLPMGARTADILGFGQNARIGQLQVLLILDQPDPDDYDQYDAMFQIF
jgi:hypothetical protein